jgi:hypothetical protein
MNWRRWYSRGVIPVDSDQLADLKTRQNFIKGFEEAAFRHIKACLNSGVLTDEDLQRVLHKFFASATFGARLDEIARIRAYTLDADTDVWSSDDDGNMQSLDHRMAEVKLIHDFSQVAITK